MSENHSVRKNSEDQYAHELEDKIVDIVRRCRNCNYCSMVCPLFESTRGFQVQSPSGILQALSYAIKLGEVDGGMQTDLRDIVYACTTCGSCVLKCKSSGPGVPLVDAIEAGRELLVERMVGPMPEQIEALESLEQEGNPYGEPASTRLNWLREFEKKQKLTYKSIPAQKAEILLYVGCTPSYNERISETAIAVMKLLEAMGADYGILRDEQCCGCTAKRMGEEGLFEELSNKNFEAFRDSGVQRIITISPHCYNTFVNEYQEDMKEITIQHYTQFFAEALAQKSLIPKHKIKNTVTYHDPCYLGKKNQVYEPPRQILNSITEKSPVEMARHHDDSLCCGGGGGRMWFEPEETERLSETRINQALAVGANIIATACPWCHIQLEDAVKTSGNEGKVEVIDVAELLAEAVAEREDG
jgi:Fe-S oxidoreductase